MNTAEPLAAESPPPPVAWQPLTPRGLAAFSEATFGRVFVAQLITASLAAVTVVWFLVTCWFPTIRQALTRLPESGVIENAELRIPVHSPTLLGQGRWLAMVVQSEQGKEAVISDLLVEFHQRELLICSLWGCVVFPYPSGWSIQFNRPELQPWWGAWEPMILSMVWLGVVSGLFIVWWVLATIYAPLVWMIAFMKDRALSIPGSWRIAAMALVPGALLEVLGIVLYAFRLVDLIGLLTLSGLHFVLPWIYVIAAMQALPRATPKSPRWKNPFTKMPEQEAAEERQNGNNG